MSATTEKLYAGDSGLLEFEATVLEVRTDGAHPMVVLDRTAFYPTGGGQPHDTGRLAGSAVLDVTAEDGRILHAVDSAAGIEPGAAVQGAVDAARRLDHLQQHSGQHLLSQAFVRIAEAGTQSFHLGVDTCGIDLDDEVDDDALRAAEQLTNQVIFEDRAVHVHEVGPDELDRFPGLRATYHGERIRVIEVEDFDVSTCGGTHARRSGQVGLLTILASERHKGGSRVHFVCGGRALEQFRRSHGVVRELGRRLDVGRDRILARVEKLEESARAAQRRAGRWFEEAIQARAEALRDATPLERGRRVVLADTGDLSRAELEELARRVVDAEGTLAILATRDAGVVRLMLARSNDQSLHCGEWMKTLTSQQPVRGGGGPPLAQGVVESEALLAGVLEAAVQLVPEASS